ncbi:MAG TPA: MBL fold metallo-hydrolase [Acidimicrobiales bacterium]|nr:MBL fold metallo-hydrolase [Acidimicrobiales bacterium]
MTTTRHDHPEAHRLPPPRTERVADGVFAYVQPDGGWWINNTGFVVGERTVLCIDTCATERRTRAFLDAVSTVAGHDRAPRLVVNTHHHGDHTNGNSLVPASAIIGHRLCRDAMLATGILRPRGIWDDVEWGELEPAPPFLTFDHRMDVYVDDLLVELHHIGVPAHTTNDVVAWIPEHRVLFTGDLVFNGGTPFVLMGSVSGSLVALDRLMDFDAEVVVPGHGEPCTLDVVDTIGEYLRFLQDTASEAARAGATPLEAAQGADLGQFSSLMHPERLAGNLHRALAECAGARPGDPVDLAAAFVDMVAMNGGAPLPCLA